MTAPKKTKKRAAPKPKKGPEEMTAAPIYFDPNTYLDLMKSADVTKAFEALAIPGFDTKAVAEAQQRNVQAIADANRVVFEGYKPLVEKQIAMFKDGVAEMTDAAKELGVVPMNAEIIEKRGEDGIEEGCLSVPGARALVPRAAEVTVKALDRDGKEYTFDADDLLAICVQHELDHLEGKLFVDYLSPLKRKRIQDKLAKIKRFNEKQAK